MEQGGTKLPFFGGKMARPSKASSVIRIEKKSHRTKRELKHREIEEQKTISGIAIKEHPDVRRNPEAHKTFLKLKKILTAIDKNDAMYEMQINRYCMITAEAVETEEMRLRLEQMLSEVEEHRADYEFKDYMKTVLDINKQLSAADRSLHSKRQQLANIEKENCMTIASAQRIVTKKPESKINALKEALNG